MLLEIYGTALNILISHLFIVYFVEKVEVPLEVKITYTIEFT